MVARREQRRRPQATEGLAPAVVAALRAGQPRLAIVARVEPIELSNEDAGLRDVVGRHTCAHHTRRVRRCELICHMALVGSCVRSMPLWHVPRRYRSLRSAMCASAVIGGGDGGGKMGGGGRLGSAGCRGHADGGGGGDGGSPGGGNGGGKGGGGGFGGGDSTKMNATSALGGKDGAMALT